MRRLQVSNPLQAIACGQFALSIMQVVFMFYYVKVYLNVFHVSQWWFNVAQTLFMIWNAVNDPLFGYMQDHPGSWLNSRTSVIKYFSPFLVASFMFMWIPWATDGNGIEGIHLILSLFLYDAFFSAIGVAWSALFADSTKDPRMRVSAMKYSQLAILLSVNAVAIAEKLSHSLESLTAFQLVCAFFALLAFFCLQLAGSLQPLNLLPMSENDDAHSLLSESPPQRAGSMSFKTAWDLSKQVIRENDFLSIIATNFIHTARSVIHMNFASTATEILIPQDILPKGSIRLSLFYGILTLGPQVLLILNDKMVIRFGAYRLFIFSFIVSILSGLFFIVSSNPYFIMLFMIIDSITVHSAAPLFNIVISDFIDDDAERIGRRAPLSSLVFSLNALFVKPAQSIAPVFIVQFLNTYGYSEYLSKKVVAEDLTNGMMYVLFLTPLILGAFQLVIFRSYSLRNKHIVSKQVL